MAASFSVPPRIVTGWSSSRELGAIAQPLGNRALLVTGRSGLRDSGITGRLVASLKASGVECVLFEEVQSEPTTDMVDAARSVLAAGRCELVVAAGGGSVMDVGKAAARLAFTDKLTASFYRDTFPPQRLPCITMPTTAGSGAEVTPNSVLTDPLRNVKESIRGPGLTPDVAIVDAELTLSCSREVTVSSGLDAFVQAVESYLSRNATPLTDSLSLYAVELAWGNLDDAVECPQKHESRLNMSYAALLAGMALSNARLGAVHGLAHAIGLRYKIPHGLLCGILLPNVLYFNREVARDKFAVLENVLGKDPTKAAEELLWNFGETSALDLRPCDFGAIAEESLPSGSLKANPRTVGRQDIMDILALVCEKQKPWRK